MRAARGSCGPEDTLTSLIAHALSRYPELAERWGAFLLDQLLIEEPIETSIWPYSGKYRPDMAMTIGDRCRIIFEHKLDSPDGMDQLEHYLALCKREEKITNMAHKLAFVSPESRNLPASVYTDSDFIVIEARHPVWADLGSIIIDIEPNCSGVIELRELLDFLYLLPIELPNSLNDFIGMRDKKPFFSLIRKIGKALIERDWRYETDSTESRFIPPDDLREKLPGIQAIFCKICPVSTPHSNRIPDPCLSFSVLFETLRFSVDFADNYAHAIHNRIKKLDLPFNTYFTLDRSNRSSAAIIYLDLGALWGSNNLENTIRRTLNSLLDILDPKPLNTKGV